MKISYKEQKNKEVFKKTKSQETIRHLQISEAYRKLKDRTINEENEFMLKRLKHNEPVMNFSKLEDGFQNHLKFKKLLRKVGSDFNNLYTQKHKFLPPVRNPIRIQKNRRNLSMDGFYPQIHQYQNIEMEF